MGCRIPANELAGYPYLVPTGLLHVLKTLYARQRRLTRAEGTLHGATRPYTAAPAALTRAEGTFLGSGAATCVCLGLSTCGCGG